MNNKENLKISTKKKNGVDGSKKRRYRKRKIRKISSDGINNSQQKIII